MEKRYATSRSGQYGAKKKEVCPKCNLYMYSQASRSMIGGKATWIKTSWLCRNCGAMILDSEGFDAIRFD